MGQRFSFPCVTGACDVVRVRKPCGRYEEVPSPCVASTVMAKNPEYLVVHCSLKNGGNAVDITVINPNQDLLPGVPYMLYPKVESTGEGEDAGNIPRTMCMSVKDRQITFRSSISPNSSLKRKSLSKIDGEKST